MSGAKKQPPTADQLRARIDRGKTGEKVVGPDPAAAPLDTDAEAGGFPPTEEERALAAETQPGQPPAAPKQARLLRRLW